MATWEDGPEYAPVERPTEFADPDAAPPLSQAVPYDRQAGQAPLNRPAFADPSAPVAPLSTLVAPIEDRRDPQLPFDVANAAITDSSAWGGVHWSPPNGAPGALGGVVPATAAATARQPILLSGAGGATAPGPFGAPPPPGAPAPGTPQWFGPGAYAPTPAAPPVTARAVVDAVNLGLLITLLIGGLVYVVAPITFVIGFALSRRIRVATASVQVAWRVAVALFAVLALVFALAGPLDFSDWWGAVGVTALVLSWLMAIATVLIVRAGLRSDDVAPAAPRNPWG